MRTGRGGPAAIRRRERDLLWLGVGGAIFVFVVLAVMWVFRVPTYYPPDEASHVGYARELSHGRLPTIDTPISSEADARLAAVLQPRDARHRTIWTANHPPLYYAMAAVPLRIGTHIGHPLWGVLAARLLSVGLSALGLIALAYVVLQLAPGRPQLAVAATGLVALLPSFIRISARVYNDPLAFLTTTAALAAAVAFVVRGPSAARLAAVAASAALAAMTRASGLLVVGVAGLAVLVGVLRASEGSAWRRLWHAVIWASAVGAAVVAAVGWFYLRNLKLYGDFTGSAALLDRFGRIPKGTIPGLLTDPGFWRLQHWSLWDYASLPKVKRNLAKRLWLLGLVPLAGLLLAGVGRLVGATRGRPPDPARTVAVGLCVALLGLLQLSAVQFASDGGGAHIRYLFPSLVTVGLCTAVGLTMLPGGRRGVPTVVMLVAMAAVDLWFWWPYLGVIRISSQPVLLVVVVPVLLLGLGLHATALWRLAPDAPAPGPAGMPTSSPPHDGTSEQLATTPATP